MVREADERFLVDPSNRERDALGYAVESLLWLEAQTGADWAHSITEPFWTAVRSVLTWFDTGEVTLQDTAHQVQKALAEWRNDVEDVPNHPFSQLGRVLAGNMGEHLELRAPVVSITCNEVLEGIANEYVVGEWPLSQKAYLTQLGLCTVVLATVAEACFWAARDGQESLTRELRRAFSDGGRQLRQQLAMLSVAARGRAWGLRVALVDEGTAQAPDLEVSERGNALFVECTSRTARATVPNNSDTIAEAIATAWSEKNRKFRDEDHRPGLVTLELSSLPVDDMFGQFLLRSLVSTVELDTPCGAKRTINVYSSRNPADEFMASESIRRGLIGVLASALWSQRALDYDIKGIAVHCDQELRVDTRQGGSISRPQRGLLVWRGDMDPTFMLALRVSEPAIPTSTPTPTAYLV